MQSLSEHVRLQNSWISTPMHQGLMGRDATSLQPFSALYARKVHSALADNESGRLSVSIKITESNVSSMPKPCKKEPFHVQYNKYGKCGDLQAGLLSLLKGPPSLAPSVNLDEQNSDQKRNMQNSVWPLHAKFRPKEEHKKACMSQNDPNVLNVPNCEREQRRKTQSRSRNCTPWKFLVADV